MNGVTQQYLVNVLQHLIASHSQKISNNKAILFGGSYRKNNDEFGCTSNIYSAEMTKDAVVSKYDVFMNSMYASIALGKAS